MTTEVVKSQSSTPFPKGDVKFTAAKNFTSQVEKNASKINEDKSGVRQTKTASQIAFYNQVKNLCIDEAHSAAWDSFYNDMADMLLDDPSKHSKVHTTSSLNSESSNKQVDFDLPKSKKQKKEDGKSLFI